MVSVPELPCMKLIILTVLHSMKCNIRSEQLKALLTPKDKGDEGAEVCIYNQVFFCFPNEEKPFCVARSWQTDLVKVLMKKYTLEEAIIIASKACTACRKELAFSYGLPWGEAKPTRVSSCIFCQGEKGSCNTQKNLTTTSED